MEKNQFKALLESEKYSPMSELAMNTLAAVMANTKRETEIGLAEGTIAADVAQFTPFLLPMLRRIYPTLIANELLGVQPMSGPTGFIYNLTNRFVGNQAAPINPNVKAQILDFGPDSSNPDATITAPTIGDTITGEDVTGTEVTAEVVYVEPASHNRDQATPGAATSPTGSITFNNAFASRVLVEIKTGTKFANGTVVAGGTLAATAGTVILPATFSSEAAWLGLLPSYSGSYTTANGEIRGTVGNEMNEVGIAVERKQIEARTRKLRAEYTIEMYQDLKAMHGVLADQELMALMGYEIKAQTDREVVDFVNANSTLEGEFIINDGLARDASISQDGRWEIEKYRMFAAKLSDMSREIGRLNRRGAANKLLVSPKVLTMLEQIGGFTASNVDSTINTQTANGGVVGRFDNKFSVIVDNFAKSEYATLVYKGSNQDSIGVYAPYTPVQIQKVTHVSTGQPALIAMTRYGLTTNPWQDSAVEMGEASPYAKTISVDFSATALA